MANLHIRTLTDLRAAVRLARREQGLKATQVATKFGRSRDLLHRLETGGDVTTRIYRYQRSPGGPELEDHTMALRLWSGKTQRSKAYPLPEELRRFGRDVCGVRDPQTPLERIAQAMADTLHDAASDPRIPAGLLELLRPVWENGIRYAR